MEKDLVHRFHKRKRSSSNPVQKHTRRRLTTIEYEYIPLPEDEEEELVEEEVVEKVVEKEEEEEPVEEEEEEDPEEEEEEEPVEEEEEEDPEEEEEDPEEEGEGCEIELEDYVHCQGSENHDEDVGENNPMEDDEATSKFKGIDPISATLSNPKVLDCCSCCQPLTIPVFQCEKGHFACFTCCALGRECLECSSRIHYNRCKAIEKVLESINISCLNAKYGCKETLSYSERNNHEKKCIYIPCLCPHKGCDFIHSYNNLHSYNDFYNSCMIAVTFLQ
ncbi:E3 ubiquitin-protein ligase SINA-like 5 [Gastrolobium bilobum]|uniref:E3 ubiquitin-protein ligase SINA-like 5 n=1 Tax=Gastrolobium bilobum TaxID=150636 RepID=UPI002AB29F9F|nr:E3 ubiquitin-protein ligase SINA-like 5 [Gastrolobium bilobum]